VTTISVMQRWVLPAMARYFRLELAGDVAAIPQWSREPCIFVMNHTAILGLEVYLLNAALHRLRPDAPPPHTTVWPRFLSMPVIGGFYRAAGCIPMSIDGATAALRAGDSLLILPEGPDATDVREAVNRFHSGFLRVVRALQGERDIPVVPFGWAGVDEANPWRVITNPALVRLLMKPLMPRFEFALLPRPPMFRPSKVVFVVGAPLRFTRADLAGEAALAAQVTRVREAVIALVAQATALRRDRIEHSAAERLLHRVTGTDHIAWERHA
jgi:1-acyl-sn-glycerol-3-phosphate acyltransferase